MVMPCCFLLVLRMGKRSANSKITLTSSRSRSLLTVTTWLMTVTTWRMTVTTWLMTVTTWLMEHLGAMGSNGHFNHKLQTSFELESGFAETQLLYLRNTRLNLSSFARTTKVYFSKLAFKLP
jgi:hypothetical protein